MIQTLIKDITNKTHLTQHEASWLLQHICNKSSAELAILTALPKKQIIALSRILNKIKKDHQPLAYILKKVPFLNLNIQVKKPILIPRHETEQWVAQIIANIPENSVRSILDIGTGTGCIALALASHFKQAEVIGIDINPAALRLAKKNALINGIDNAKFMHSNLFQNLKNKRFDLIVSNPPYIDPAKKESLNKQVIEWEDAQALFAHDHGLEIITKILQNAGKYLTDRDDLQYQLIFEIDYDQNDTIKNLAQKHHWHCDIAKDLFGQWRTAWCKKKS